MTYKVFVDGQEGTTGLQINEYLAKRADVALLKIDSDKRKDLAERKRLINESDVTFLCLPDEAAKESVALVDNPKTCIIDASTAHRVDPAWTFGLPELAKEQRAKIRASKRIANPGCHDRQPRCRRESRDRGARPGAARGIRGAPHHQHFGLGRSSPRRDRRGRRERL